MTHPLAPKPGDEGRSPHWPSVRAAHLLREPHCQACGRGEHLNVHHVLPFHVHPELELAPANLITLCEPAGTGCHLIFGHWYDWHAWNPNVRFWAGAIAHEITTRATAEVARKGKT